MASTIQPISGAAACPRAAAPAAAAATAAAPNAAASDHVALRNGELTPLLTASLAVAAQLVPGVVEAEGATGAATAIGIGVRAAVANPTVKAALSLGAGVAGGYARSLMHDATAGQPAVKGVTDFGHSLDASVHVFFGIAPSDTHQ